MTHIKKHCTHSGSNNKTTLFTLAPSILWYEYHHTQHGGSGCRHRRLLGCNSIFHSLFSSAHTFERKHYICDCRKAKQLNENRMEIFSLPRCQKRNMKVSYSLQWIKKFGFFFSPALALSVSFALFILFDTVERHTRTRLKYIDRRTMPCNAYIVMYEHIEHWTWIRFNSTISY